MPTEPPNRSGRRITPLPGRDPALAWRALAIAELAVWLLANNGALLLSVTLDWDEPEPEPRLGYRPHPDRALDPRPFAFPPIAAALEGAAAVLLDALRDRWPPWARPSRLGLVTDGAGIAFSPDDPWPEAPGWLSRQARGAACLTQIVPFAAGGPWSTLIDRAAHPRRV